LLEHDTHELGQATVQSTAQDEVKDDLEEKEAIEREITRRGVTDYHWPLGDIPHTYMIIVTANIGLLPAPVKSQLHQARCPLIVNANYGIA